MDNKNKELSGKLDLLSKNYKIINKNYLCHLNNVIGSGTFGKVLYCSTMDSKNEYAIKFEKSNVKSSVIEIEYEIYQSLAGGVGIPNIVWTGEYKKYKLMIMDLLGPSLDKFFIFCNKRFYYLTASLIGIEMIKRVQYMHSKGFLHRDIKPNNFMLGTFSKELNAVNDKTVYIIDFGLSKEYVDLDTCEHLPFKEGRRFIGTPRYASIGTHLGYRQSRRDDLESIAYILIYFVLGELPWQGIKAKSKSEKKEKILEMKLKTDFSKDKRIPKEFLAFLEYCKDLRYEDKPDYKFICKLIQKIVNSYDDKGEYDQSKHIWEWNYKMLSALESPSEYKTQNDAFNKLFDGYPISSFDNYLKKLTELTQLSNSNRLPSSSSTTSNTNPNTMNNYGKEKECREDSTNDLFNNINLNSEDKKEIDISKNSNTNDINRTKNTNQTSSIKKNFYNYK